MQALFACSSLPCEASPPWINQSTVISRFLPVINGAFDDDESLTTNVDDEFDGGGAPAFDVELLHDGEGLTWARLNIEYSQDGNLTVAYKGREIINRPVEYQPSAGQLVFGGRTGGANAFHHIDNIILRTNDDVGGGNGPPRLLAGDADMDLDFDQRDLVQVQIAAKYLTGNAATWGEGDWNGAPGGEQGSPPAGNGLFDQIDIISALGAGTYLTGPYAALAGEGQSGDGQTSIVYDPTSGAVSVDAPAGVELTSINIDSAGGIFTAAAAEDLGGSFDNDADGNIFKATFGGSFGSVSFGNVAQTGLAKDFVLNDLTAVGSLAGGGDLGNVDLVYVPEPSTMVMVVFGMLIGLRFSRRTG